MNITKRQTSVLDSQLVNSLPSSVELGMLNSLLLLIGVIGLATANPLPSVFAMLQLKVLLTCYWRKGVPPVVVLLFLIPWLEISTGILQANLSGISLNELLNGNGETAYWLSCIGLYAVHFGFYPIFKSVPLAPIEKLKEFAQRTSLNRLILLYFAIGPTTGLIASFLGKGSALMQIITYFNEVSLVVLITICLRQMLLKEFTRVYFGFLGFVLITSFYSFFSEWRVLFFAIFIAYGTYTTIDKRAVFRIAFLALFVGNLLFMWQAIKPIYRAYLTGEKEQVGMLKSQGVSIGRKEALDRFFGLAVDFYSGELLGDSNSAQEQLLEGTLSRIGYLDFFSRTLEKVPYQIEHEEGNLLLSNLSFALIPRFLNSKKGVKDDGAKVQKYTGFMVSDSASFSLGHYTEYYIDFGKYFMMLPLFILGFLGGKIYRFAVNSVSKNYNPLFLSGFIFAFLNEWGSFQNDAIWIYGLTFFGFICHGFVFRIIYNAIDKISHVK